MKIIRICSVFVVNDNNQVLSVEQHYESLNRAAWTLPGGGVEDHETPEQAAKREVTEETGYSIKGAGVPVYHCVVSAPNNICFDVYGLLYRDYSGELAITEPEISRVAFLDTVDAQKRMRMIDDEARLEPIMHVLQHLKQGKTPACYRRHYVVDAQRRIIASTDISE